MSVHWLVCRCVGLSPDGIDFPIKTLKDQFFDVSKLPVTLSVIQYISIGCDGILNRHKQVCIHEISRSPARLCPLRQKRYGPTDQ